MNRLAAIVSKKERLVIGLNSGTSVDGVDAICARICGGGFDLKFEVLATAKTPYSKDLRETLLRAPHLDLVTVTGLHVDVAEVFATAAAKVASEAGRTLGEVDLIGSHGQTVCHLPSLEPLGRATCQIGDLDVIAERTGVVTIGDFRSRDMAAGGAGAPLVPYLDWLLFRTRPRTLCLNVGGIANVTLVTEDLEGCRALDIGPGNMPLDILASCITGGQEDFDPSGRLASQGSILEPLLMELLRHPFLKRPPPKTTGRESFGREFVLELKNRYGPASDLDILATLTLFVARSVKDSCDLFLKVEGGARGLVVSGGGVHNRTLMKHLKDEFFPVPVSSLADEGIDPDFKEALLFAVLANERVLGNASNLPQVTGARWPVCLGKFAI